MSRLFRNDSPGVLTLEQAFALEKKRMAERRRDTAQTRAEAADDFTFPAGGILAGFNPHHARNAHRLAAQGRGSDTEVAHMARGELVVPLALQNPEVLDALRRAAAAHNIPLEMLKVGNARNRINPHTGAPEFGVMDTVRQYGNRALEAGKDGIGWLSKGAEPFEDDESGKRGIALPAEASLPPASQPSTDDFKYDPNGPSPEGLFMSDPVGSVKAIWHGVRSRQEARDRFVGGPAEATLQGGEADAWRHARWNQRMVNDFGPEKAQIFADYIEQRNGDSNPSGDRAMDLYNNQIGRGLVGDRSKTIIDNLLNSGRLRTSRW